MTRLANPSMAETSSVLDTWTVPLTDPARYARACRARALVLTRQGHSREAQWLDDLAQIVLCDAYRRLGASRHLDTSRSLLTCTPMPTPAHMLQT